MRTGEIQNYVISIKWTRIKNSDGINMSSGGPRIEPCGTPVLMGKCFDLFSVELTKMKQWNKQAI